MVSELLRSFTGGLVDDRSAVLKHVLNMFLTSVGVFLIVFWGCYMSLGIHYERWSITGTNVGAAFQATWDAPFLGANVAGNFADTVTNVETQFHTYYGNNWATAYAAVVADVPVEELVHVREWKLRTPDAAGNPLLWYIYDATFVLLQGGFALALAKMVSFACENQDKAFKIGAMVGLVGIAAVRVLDSMTVADQDAYWTSDAFGNWKPEDCQAIDRSGWAADFEGDGDSTAFRAWHNNTDNKARDHYRLMKTLTLVVLLLAAPFINVLQDVKGFVKRGMDNNMLNCFVFLLGSLFLVFLMIAETYAVDTFGTMWADEWVRFLVTASWAGACLLFSSPNSNGVSLNPNMLALCVFYIALPVYAWTMFGWTDECMLNVLFHMAALGGAARAIGLITAQNALASGDSDSAVEAAAMSQVPVLFTEAMIVFLEMYKVGDLTDEQVLMSLGIYAGYEIVRELFLPFGRLTTELQGWTGGLVFRKSAAVVPEGYAMSGNGAEAAQSRTNSALVAQCAVIMSGAMIWALILSEKLLYSVFFEPLIDGAGFDRAIEDTTNSVLNASVTLAGMAGASATVPAAVASDNLVNSPCGTYDKFSYTKSFSVSFRESLREDFAKGEAGITDDQFLMGMLVGLAQIVVGYFLMFMTQKKAEKNSIHMESQWAREDELKGKYGLVYTFLVLITIFSLWRSYEADVDQKYTPNYVLGCWEKTNNADFTYTARTCGSA